MALAPLASLPPPMNDGPLKEVWLYLRRLYSVIDNMRKGKLACLTTVTLTAGTTTTTLTDIRISQQSGLYLMPTTANASAALAATYMVPANGTATITHANNAQTDRTFTVAIIG